MDLLERDASLAALHDCLGLVRGERGRVCLVSGEAGIGKSALVDRFCTDGRKNARILRGACDALSTPRPLGPLLDIAPQAGGHLADLVNEGAEREELFAAFLEAFSGRRPTVAVIEDLHWADDATLDLVRFVGRRLAGRAAMMILTYRDDEIHNDHPLRPVLGDLTSGGVVRVPLVRLSPDAVALLADGHAVDPAKLHERTAGNPFYVTEALAVPAGEIPPTVRDAVLGRAARLPPNAREVLDVAAVVPSRIESWVLEGVSGPRPVDIDACIAAGMLRKDADGFAFRHELARLAVQAAIPPARRASLHQAIARLLVTRGGVVDSARISAHADEAGDTQVVLAHAPVAGAQAARLGAHHEAAAQYARALRHADGLPATRQAELFVNYAEECELTDRPSEAVDAGQRAVALWRQVGEPRREGMALTALASALWSAGRNAESEEALDAALYAMVALGPGPELASAYASRATTRMLARDLVGASSWGRLAIDLATQVDDDKALARALNTVGCVALLRGDPDGRAILERSIAVAEGIGSESYVGLGLSNLGTGLGETRDYAAADQYLQAAIAHAGRDDSDARHHYVTAWWARSNFEQGRWDEAVRIVSPLLRQPGMSPISRIVALTVLGRLRARRGDPGVDDVLNEAWDLAVGTGDLQRLWPVAAGRAEAAWLSGQVEHIGELIGDTFRLAQQFDHQWSIGELGYWLWRAGDLHDPPTGAYKPYALHIAGHYAAAAASWDTIGCPYEHALALADCDNEAALRGALACFEELGAPAAAATTRRRLRDLGVRNVPRGPRQATRANPAGLTARQMQVLSLLMKGCRNAVIAERLFISEKTAGHHVSAVLTKLGAGTRGEAVAIAAQRQLLSEQDGDPNTAI